MGEAMNHSVSSLKSGGALLWLLCALLFRTLRALQAKNASMPFACEEISTTDADSSDFFPYQPSILFEDMKALALCAIGVLICHAAVESQCIHENDGSNREPRHQPSQPSPL